MKRLRSRGEVPGDGKLLRLLLLLLSLELTLPRLLLEHSSP